MVRPALVAICTCAAAHDSREDRVRASLGAEIPYAPGREGGCVSISSVSVTGDARGLSVSQASRSIIRFLGTGPAGLWVGRPGRPEPSARHAILALARPPRCVLTDHSRRVLWASSGICGALSGAAPWLFGGALLRAAHWASSGSAELSVEQRCVCLARPSSGRRPSRGPLAGCAASLTRARPPPWEVAPSTLK